MLGHLVHIRHFLVIFKHCEHNTLQFSWKWFFWFRSSCTLELPSDYPAKLLPWLLRLDGWKSVSQPWLLDLSALQKTCVNNRKAFFTALTKNTVFENNSKYLIFSFLNQNQKFKSPKRILSFSINFCPITDWPVW